MIRPATLADVNVILEIAEQQVDELYPRLKKDKDKMRRVIIETISSAKHFCWVSVENNAVGGAIIGVVNQNTWAQRQCCNIMMWVAKKSGDGVRLLLQLKNWITSRRAIKVAGFSPDSDEIDSRVWKLATMLGFKQHGGAYFFYN